MKETTLHKIRIWYGIVLTALTLLLGVLFIVSASHIYFSCGEGEMYSREIVKKHLIPLLAPAIIWIITAIGGGVLSCVLPKEKDKIKKNDSAEILQSLRNRMPESAKEMEEYSSLRSYDKARKIARWVCAGVCLVSAVISLIYLLNPSHFPSEHLKAELGRMFKFVLPCVAVSFIACIVASVFEVIYAKKVLLSAREIVKKTAKEGRKEDKPVLRQPSFAVLTAIRATMFCVGVLFIVLGILNGGANEVLVKAINICSECIGLG